MSFKSFRRKVLQRSHEGIHPHRYQALCISEFCVKTLTAYFSVFHLWWTCTWKSMDGVRTEQDLTMETLYRLDYEVFIKREVLSPHPHQLILILIVKVRYFNQLFSCCFVFFIQRFYSSWEENPWTWFLPQKMVDTLITCSLRLLLFSLQQHLWHLQAAWASVEVLRPDLCLQLPGSLRHPLKLARCPWWSKGSPKKINLGTKWLVNKQRFW